MEKAMISLHRFGVVAAIGFAVTLLHAAPEYTFKIAFKNGAQKEFATSDISKITFNSDIEEAKSENISLAKAINSSSSKEVKKPINVKFKSVKWNAKQYKLKIILDKPTIVDVDLHDIHGELLTSYSVYGTNGVAIISFNNTNFPRGTYVAEIHAGNKSTTKQINFTK